jgi:hypothetical protein
LAARLTQRLTCCGQGHGLGGWLFGVRRRVFFGRDLRVGLLGVQFGDLGSGGRDKFADFDATQAAAFGLAFQVGQLFTFACQRCLGRDKLLFQLGGRTRGGQQLH